MAKRGKKVEPVEVAAEEVSDGDTSRLWEHTLNDAQKAIQGMIAAARAAMREGDERAASRVTAGKSDLANLERIAERLDTGYYKS
jgi:hypothetical protein